jgi:hypothetical protein
MLEVSDDAGDGIDITFRAAVTHCAARIGIDTKNTDGLPIQSRDARGEHLVYTIRRVISIPPPVLARE